MRNTRTLSYALEHKTFIVCISASALLIALYAYFLISTVATIALREEAALSIRQVSSEVSALEASYLEKKLGITRELASALGFTTVDEPTYVTRTTLSTVALSSR
jgi:hypothetical protein